MKCLILFDFPADSSNEYGRLNPQHSVALEGEVVTLTCKSHTDPQWSKEEGRINSHSVFQNSLLLYEVTEEDSGRYICYGTYPSGELFDESATVLVGGRPEKQYAQI